MKRFFVSSVLIALSAIILNAKVYLPPIFADNMVLQQNENVALWGKAKPNAKLTITTNWSKVKTVVTTDDAGQWKARIATPQAGGPYEIAFSDGEKLTLKNIMIGEVWICMGQSNMEMRMRGFGGQPVLGAPDLILGAKPSLPIRSCNIDRKLALEPEAECNATWYEHTPKGVAEASATAYFFAKRLYETLEIPIGIINVSWGGTPIFGWMNPELLEKEFSNDIDLSDLQAKRWRGWNDYQMPGVLYNGMLHSVIPYTAKGFIWYQGCNDRMQYKLYKQWQPAFAKMLREEWGNDKMPFYFTQLAPYRYEDPNLPHLGYMMWIQAQTLDMIPFSGMATTHDAGELNCIHPANKKVVGDRLAFLALANDYGYDYIDANPPIAIQFEFSEGEALVTFEAGKMGLSPINMDIDGFELAGEDQIFYPAKGILINDQGYRKVKVYKCPEVPNPVAVRYGMKNWSEATLFNTYGIPASPFRSDTW